MNRSQAMLKALTYDALLRHYDVNWTVHLYTAFCQSIPSGPILELGAGTGHVLGPLLEQGIEAYGLELNPHMLQRGQQNLQHMGYPDGASRLLTGDMRSFRHERQYRGIILPYNTLALLCTRKEVIQMLATIRQHLLPFGEFMFDLNLPVDQDWAVGAWQREPLTLTIDGVELCIHERGIFDPSTHIHQWKQQVIVRDGPTFEIRRTLRHWHPHELTTLFDETGWRFHPAPIDQAGRAINPQSRLFIGRAHPV